MARVTLSRNLQDLIQPQLLPHVDAVADRLATDFRAHARSVVGYGPNRSYQGGSLGPYGHYADEVTAGSAMIRRRARGWIVATKFTARFLEGGTSKMAGRHVMESFGRSSGYRYRKARSR
jgi:hypothetical protein